MGIQINGATDSITAIDGTIDVVSAIGNAGVVTATAFVGNITGNVTGNINHASTLELQTGGVTRAHFNSSGHFNVAGISTFTGVSNHNSSLNMLAGNNIVLQNDANSANCQIDCYGGAGFRLTSYNQTMFTCENGNNTKFYTNSGTSRLEITNGGDVLVVTGTLHIPDALQHYADTDTKIRFPAADTITAETAGSERLRITSAGLVGIGTVSPAHALDIQGSSASFTKIALSNQTMNTSKYEIIFGDQGQVNHVVAANREITFATNGSSNERLRIDSSGKLLVGTTAAGSSGVDNLVLYRNGNGGITIRNNANQNGNLYFSRGTSGTDEYKGYIQYQHAQDVMVFGTAHTERARITGGGQLLIGTTTSPAYTNRRFTVYDSTNSGTCSLEIRGSSSGDSRLYFTSSTTAGQLGAYAGKVYYGHADNVMAFYTAGTERLRISGTGPQLFLGGTSSVNEITETSSNSGLVIGNTSMGNGGLAIINSTSGTGRIYFGDSVGGNAARNRGQINYYHNGDYMLFAAAGSERLRIDSNGKLILSNSEGIQLSAKTSSLYAVNGSLSYYSTTNGVYLNGAGDSGWLRLSASGTSNNRTAINIYAQSANTYADGIDFKTNSGLRMLIKDGHIFFNGMSNLTASGSNKGINFENSANNGRINIHANSSAGNALGISFYNNGNNVGTIYYGTSSTAYNTSSDYRLKENQVAISDGIARLKTLKPYRFNFKVDPDKTVDGFFAHEVTAVPEAIQGEKDAENMQQLDYAKLTPLLTAALQEAIAKIETLETKVAALEGS